MVAGLRAAQRALEGVLKIHPKHQGVTLRNADVVRARLATLEAVFRSFGWLDGEHALVPERADD
jgi:hypothetical protein